GSRSDEPLISNSKFQIRNSQFAIRNSCGGEGGIRTHGTVPRSQHFQCCQFNHSCTSPREEFRISDCGLRNSKTTAKKPKRLSSKQSEIRNPESLHPLMPRRETISLY